MTSSPSNSTGVVSTFPRQDIFEKDKTPAWMSQHLGYAEFLLLRYRPETQRMTRFFNGYLGITNPQSIEYLTKTYGQENKAPYISYRISKTKIDLLHGEWLKRPLISTVTTVNSEAVSEKMYQQNFMRGAMMLRDEIKTVKDVAGVDVMDGMEIPKDEAAFEAMSFKDKIEDVMQLILNKQILNLDVKKKIGECFKDCEITSYAYIRIRLNQKGEVELDWIDPRCAIFEAVGGDDYMEKSPIMGALTTVPIHRVLLEYELTQEQRNQLDNIRQQPDRYIGSNGSNGLGRGYVRYMEGTKNLVVDVIHIEWDSVRPLYYKIVPKTNAQLELDPTTSTYTYELSAEKYEANKEYHDKMVAKGEYEIVTKYITEKYEATRIAGIVDVNMRKVQGVKRSIDNPSTIVSTTYVGYVHGRVNGVTVSIQQLIENFSNIYDLIQYKKNMEIAKMKGKYLTIDKAGLGPKQNLQETYYRLVNDQVVEYDSSATGNIGGRQLDPSVMFKEGDLGMSASFKELLVAEQNVIQNINQITGINENRQGITMASSTATAQQSDIANSRTITEGLFYGFSGFTKRVMKAIVDKSAVSYAFYQKDKGVMLLGGQKYAFLQNSMDLVKRDYELDIEDGSKYMEISEKIEAMMQVSLNAKEIRTMDALNVLLAETLSQKLAYLEQGWKDMQESIAQSQASAQQSQEQIAAQQLQTQLQISREQREDIQNQEKDVAILKGQVQMEIDNNKAQNDAQLQRDQNMADAIIKSEPPSQS